MLSKRCGTGCVRRGATTKQVKPDHTHVAPTLIATCPERRQEVTLQRTDTPKRQHRPETTIAFELAMPEADSGAEVDCIHWLWPASQTASSIDVPHWLVTTKGEVDD